MFLTQGRGGIMKIKVMKILLAIVILNGFILIDAHSATKLSEKASEIKIGMSRQSVIRLLGSATWAFIPGEEGDCALPNPSIGLELYWRNPGCAPVVVQFDHSNIVMGWDEGRLCIKDAHVLEPSDECSCKKSDRVKFCR
jgi:hypothetical protein